MFLKQLFKILKKSKLQTFKFLPSHMNTIYCLNNVFHYYVQLPRTRTNHLLPPPTHIL